MKGTVVRFDAGAVADATGFFAAPGSVLVEISAAGEEEGRAAENDRLPRLLASGDTAEVCRHPASAEAQVVSLPNHIILPGLVNAHTHLDLTHIGPRPHRPADGFVPWVNMIRQQRLHEPEQIAASVRRGIALSLAGGTVAVGDIAGAPRGKPSFEPWNTLQDSPMLGVSFLEFFSRGKFREQGLQAGLDTLRHGLETQGEHGTDQWTGRPARSKPLPVRPGETPGPLIRLGLQPHAPNTVAFTSFQQATQAAVQRQVPLCTHLAETPEEARFIAKGDGPQKDLLVELGAWDDSAGNDIGRGLHPVEHLAEVLAQARYLVAHVNHADDRAIEILSRTQTRVAYCPRASSYFHAEAHFGPHRYRDMIEAGICVALGTDSIVNLPAAARDEQSGGMSILDEMRWLYRRDQTDPLTLLRMATINGAIALGLEPELFMLSAATAGKRIVGLIGVEIEGSQKPHRRDSVLREVWLSEARPRLLLCQEAKKGARE